MQIVQLVTPLFKLKPSELSEQGDEIGAQDGMAIQESTATWYLEQCDVRDYSQRQYSEDEEIQLHSTISSLAQSSTKAGLLLKDVVNKSHCSSNMGIIPFSTYDRLDRVLLATIYLATY